MNNERFIPKLIFRSSFIQTMFGSFRPKNYGKHPMLDTAKEMILSGENGEKLLAYYSKQFRNPKGTVVLIHGWEGSSDSSYILRTGKYLFDKGFDIIRLNLRDHGKSHHLNKGIFKSTLIDETFGAVRNAALLNESIPFYVVGFSLGGNFALRIALKEVKIKIKNLKHVVAISPVIEPMKSMTATDKNRLIKKYFIKKWKRSLLIKQALFPDIYNFSHINRFKTLSDMMREFVPKYTEFQSEEEYYKRYTLSKNSFNGLAVPSTIITSEDDPIIPVEDFYSLEQNPNLNIIIQPYGGHSGFFDIFPYKVWYEEKILEIFST